MARIPMLWDCRFIVLLRLPERQASIYMMIMVKDLPIEERPREKLLAAGPSFLSNTELLAILLRTGTRQDSVLRLAEENRRLRADLDERDEESFTEYAYPLEEITCACEQAGLRVEQVVDGESFGPLRPDSARYFITAVKQAAGENDACQD